MRPCPAPAPERHCACMDASAGIEAQNLARRYGRRWALVDVSFKLAGGADDVVATFSAGMRKRLSFARVLLQEPRVALLDEPYGQLDPEGFDLVDDVVRELKAGGTTVIFATHQLARATALADDALLLEAGRVAWRGKASEVAG